MKASIISVLAVAIPFCPNLTDNLSERIKQRLKAVETPPQTHDEAIFLPRWTLKRLVEWLRTAHQVVCCRETVRNTLKKLGFSWKKWRKLLNKAKPAQREALVETLKPHLEAATQGKEQLVGSGSDLKTPV